MPYMVTFTINIPPMLAYIPYMDPMGQGDGNNLPIGMIHWISGNQAWQWVIKQFQVQIVPSGEHTKSY